MAPILIDGRGLFKLGFIAVVSITLIFFGGFFAGYQKAVGFYQFASDSQSLELPVVTADEMNEWEPKTPETAVIGENIDVDQPQVGLHENASIAAVNGSHVDKHATGKQVVNKVKTKQSSKQPSRQVTGAQSVVMNRKTIPVDNKLAESIAMTEKPEITSVDFKNAKYSIQTGMYGNLINAENMMNMLQAQSLNAYISDYKNKKGDTRYNVRFGFFQNKRSALSTLSEYKELGKGDGYLVRFSAENVVKIATSDNTKGLSPDVEDSPAIKVEVIKEELEKSGLSPKAEPVKVDLVHLGKSAY